MAKRIHCVGIGGIGISAIARVLLEQGVRITGSDLRLSPVGRALAALGATVWEGHDAKYVGDADLILISSAIPEQNPEVVEARRREIPVVKRAEFLGQWLPDKIGLAVAGTHGKTTTTSMLIWILDQADLDPTFVVGGVVNGLETNARAGDGPHFVVEADEYDHMFLGLRPTVAAITHLEHDHPDCFPTFADMQSAFEQFLDLVPPGGLIVGCGDQPAVAALLQTKRASPILTCGLSEGQDWCAHSLRVNAQGGHDFEVMRLGQSWGSLSLPVPGIHNVRNALLAVAIADWLDIEQAVIAQALASFSGIQRRFQVRGERQGITVVDDYGHHPTEIATTLDGARRRYGQRPLWAVFQPHTYSRTKTLWKDFCACFDQADHVIVLDIYAAREKDTLGVSAKQLAADLAQGGADAVHVSGLDAAAAYFVEHMEPESVVITFSAGDGPRVSEQILSWLENPSGAIGA